MRLRNIRGSEQVIEDSPYVVKNATEQRGKWQQIFQNENPIMIEIGMGKGNFITTLAKENPQNNYIGIEKYTSVLLRAVQKMETDPVENLRFICIDAKLLGEVFALNEVSKIYLNFSDPWPKDRHARRRLPSKEFLKLYGEILKMDGVLEFKTDNRGLFDFAVEEAPLAGWDIHKLTYDLHQDTEMNQGNIMTEYEEKFSAKGNPICKYIIGQGNSKKE